MKQYVVLLRGINVGGNNKVSMAELKACMEKHGFTNVKTYINSGNVIFSSEKTDQIALAAEIEKIISKQFGLALKIVLVEGEAYKKIIKDAPEWWGKNPECKHNLIFVRQPITAVHALAESGEPNPELEQVAEGKGVLYISSSIAGATRTNFVRLPGRPIYKHLTIRNYNTSQKIAALLDAKT